MLKIAELLASRKIIGRDDEEYHLVNATEVSAFKAERSWYGLSLPARPAYNDRLPFTRCTTILLPCRVTLMFLYPFMSL